MRYIEYYGNGYKYKEPVYDLKDNIFPENTCWHRGLGYNKNLRYADTFITFDIETTSINEGDSHTGFMYLWQLCIGNVNSKVVYMGRRWEQFIILLAKIKNIYDLNNDNKMVIYVHYLPFEYQFIKDFLIFDSVFAKDVRKPIKIGMNSFEFRCSNALSNMSLKKFIEYSGNTIFYKLDGDEYNYGVLRTPETPLTEQELGYGYNDVRGLHDSICKLLEDDTLASIPMTSTGYVRRDVRNALKSNPKNRELFLNCALSEEDYRMCKEAFRGGDTHASRFASDVIISGVIHCVDLTSAYIWAMLTQYFPATAFREVGAVKTKKELEYYTSNFCCLFYLELFDLHLKPDETSSYISLSKTLERSGVITDNGRIIKADYVKIAVTEIDYKIIKETYTASEQVVTKMRIAERGQLPEEERKVIMSYFIAKCELKGIDDFLYGQSKSKVNACYGLHATDPVRDEIYTDGHEWKKEKVNITEALQKYYRNKNNCLIYQHALWVTGHVRLLLHRGRKLLIWPIYWDTDSLKYIGKHPKKLFKALNNEIAKDAIKKGAYYDCSNGKRYILGLFDIEKPYRRFKTLGAKKYAYEDMDGKLHITVAGVEKKRGVKALGKLENFRIGNELHNVGRTVAYYNESDIHKITVQGCTFTTASNIALMDTTYTIGVDDDYLKILRKVLGLSIDINPEIL